MDASLEYPPATQEELEYMLNAPKVKRTHCYCQTPSTYEIFCPKDYQHKTTWSEFESHLWCYDCAKDYLITLPRSGIFSGPIPIHLSAMIGMSFDRICLANNKVIHNCLQDDNPTKEQIAALNGTWVKDKALNEYEDTKYYRSKLKAEAAKLQKEDASSEKTNL